MWHVLATGGPCMPSSSRCTLSSSSRSSRVLDRRETPPTKCRRDFHAATASGSSLSSYPGLDVCQMQRPSKIADHGRQRRIRMSIRLRHSFKCERTTWEQENLAAQPLCSTLKKTIDSDLLSCPRLEHAWMEGGQPLLI